MRLQKTDRARAELRPGMRSLGQRERTVLLLVDGNRTVEDFKPLFDGAGEQIARMLLREGYLAPMVDTGQPASPGAPATVPPAPTSPPPAVSADPFDGKRSLATTRMFLFDLCERMFARRNPQQAEQFREALRQAKDRESMLEAARQMIVVIEAAAGPDRADSISERIAMLLPPETV